MTSSCAVSPAIVVPTDLPVRAATRLTRRAEGLCPVAVTR